MQMNEPVPLGTFGDSTCSYGMGSYKPPRGYGDDSPPDRSHNERGGDLIVSEDEIYAMRERMRAVEVQIRYMSDEMKEFRSEVKDLGSSIRSLTDLVSQARGARYVIGLAFMALGALATFAPTLLKMLFAGK